MEYGGGSEVDTNANIVCQLKQHCHDNGDNHDDDGLDDSSLPIPALRMRTVVFIVSILSLSCFHITQYGGLYFDDTAAIVTNQDVRTDTPLLDIFTNDFWGTRLRSLKSHKSYRPLTVLTYRLNYLVGGLEPRGYHVVNIVLYCVCCVLLIPTCSVLIGGYRLHSKSTFAAPRASFLCATLFAVHPIHTENVAAIVGRADLICMIFYLISFLSYTKFSNIYSSASWARCLGELFVLLSSACVAMLAKEQGITVLGVCICYDVIMVAKLTPNLLYQLIHNLDVPFKVDIRHLLQRMLLVVVAIITLMSVRLSIMGSQPKLQYGDNPSSFQKSVLIRVINYNYIYALNLWLLLVPWWLCFDWAMGCVPVVTSLWDPRLIPPCIMWICIVLLVKKVMGTIHTAFGRCLAMSLVLIVVPFLPAMNIFFRVGFVIAERNLFISSFGIVVLVVLGFLLLSHSSSHGRNFTKISSVLLVLLFAFRSLHRAYDWIDEIQLFTSGLNVCPLNAKVHYNIGKSNQDAGNVDRAISAYLEAIQLWKDYDQPMNNLGNIYKERNMLKDAEFYLERAVNITPTFHTAWMNLGNVKAELKKKTEAVECFVNAVRHKNVYPDAYYNWGYLHLVNGEHMEALEKLNIAVQQREDHLQAWRNKIILLGNLGMGEELLEAGTKACQIFPLDDHIHQTVGNSLGIVGNILGAEKFARAAYELNPSNMEAASTLGVIYHRLQRYEKAERYYKIALHANPHNEAMKDNYAKLRKSMTQP